jgi:hypothetical protein
MNFTRPNASNLCRGRFGRDGVGTFSARMSVWLCATVVVVVPYAEKVSVCAGAFEKKEKTRKKKLSLASYPFSQKKGPPLFLKNLFLTFE